MAAAGGEGTMRGGSKAVVALVVGAAVLAAGVAVVVVGAVLVARRLPGHVVLALDVAGSLPEGGPRPLLSEMLGEPPVTRQQLADALAAAATDPRIRAVRVRVGPLEAGFATVQEVRGLLARLAGQGKDTAAYLETAGEFSPGNREYLLASACRRVVLGPLGDVNLTGLSARVPFVRGTLDRLGIVPEFPGVGDFKTARFFFTEKDLTPADREMTGWLLASLRGQLVSGVAQSRGLPPAQVQDLIARAPLTGEEAVAAGLVDGIGDWQEFVESTRTADGRRLEEVSLRRYLRAVGPGPGAPLVAVVVVDGALVRGESGYSPLPVLGGELAGADTIAEALRAVREAGAVAVVLRVNSPGGSAVAAESIRAEVVRTAAKMPVVVSMGDVAASGGYWIACGATRIVASPATLTGSIGVYGGHLAMARFWEEKLGVTWGRVDGDPNADMFGTLDPWTPAQRATAERLLQRVYQAFVSRVAAARRMTPEEVDAVGRGRVFTGAQALEKGLVDEVGGFAEALGTAKELAGLGREAAVRLEFYPRYPTVWERLLERLGGAARAGSLARLLAEGRAPLPGVAWMPPIRIE